MNKSLKKARKEKIDKLWNDIVNHVDSISPRTIKAFEILDDARSLVFLKNLLLYRYTKEKVGEDEYIFTIHLKK